MVPLPRFQKVFKNILFFLQYFQLFRYYFIYYGNLWLVIFDVTILIVLGCHKPYPHKMIDLMGMCVCLLHWPALPHPALSLGVSAPWDTAKQMNNLYSGLSCSSERRSRTSLTSNQKLETTKLSEEGMSKAKAGWKLGLGVKVLAKWGIQRKNSWKRLEMLLEWTHGW